MKYRAFAVASILTVGVIAATAAAPKVDSPTPAPRFEDWVDADGNIPISALPPTDGNCGICDTCVLTQTSVGHIAMENANGSALKGAGWHDNCLAGDCEDKHEIDLEACPGERPDFVQYDAFSEIWQATRAGRPLPSKLPGNVRWNAARAGLEFLNCAGDIVAYLST